MKKLVFILIGLLTLSSIGYTKDEPAIKPKIDFHLIKSSISDVGEYKKATILVDISTVSSSNLALITTWYDCKNKMSLFHSVYDIFAEEFTMKYDSKWKSVNNYDSEFRDICTH